MRNPLARALTILCISASLTGCLGFSDPPQVVVQKVKPDSGLLVPCDEPMKPDRAKSINENGEALADLAQKFRDCVAKHTALIGWFD